MTAQKCNATDGDANSLIQFFFNFFFNLDNGQKMQCRRRRCRQQSHSISFFFLILMTAQKCNAADDTPTRVSFNFLKSFLYFFKFLFIYFSILMTAQKGNATDADKRLIQFFIILFLIFILIMASASASALA